MRQQMTIFEVAAFLGIFFGAAAAYCLVSPYGTVLGVLAAVGGAVTGFFIGPIFGLLFLMPFEGAARLKRYLGTGHWTESPTTENNEGPTDGDQDS